MLFCLSLCAHKLHDSDVFQNPQNSLTLVSQGAILKSPSNPTIHPQYMKFSEGGLLTALAKMFSDYQGQEFNVHIYCMILWGEVLLKL